MRNQIVILGCPRSGTKFMATLLQEHHLDVGHEFWGKDGISWFHCTGDPTLKVMNANLTIVHIVRDPIKVIASMTTAKPITWELMYRKINLNMPDNLVERSMLAWLHWNLMADRQTSLRLKVEDVREWFNSVCSRAGFPIKLKSNFSTPLNTNKREHMRLTWQDCAALNPILTANIRIQADKYGYPT